MYFLTMCKGLHDRYLQEYEDLLEAYEKAEQLLKEDESYTGYEIIKIEE